MYQNLTIDDRQPISLEDAPALMSESAAPVYDPSQRKNIFTINYLLFDF